MYSMYIVHLTKCKFDCTVLLFFFPQPVDVDCFDRVCRPATRTVFDRVCNPKQTEVNEEVGREGGKKTRKWYFFVFFNQPL